MKGAATAEEVLKKFQSQKDTLAKLVLLREKSEADKQKLEIRKRNLEVEFEKLKYLEAKDTEMYFCSIFKIITTFTTVFLQECTTNGKNAK